MLAFFAPPARKLLEKVAAGLGGKGLALPLCMTPGEARAHRQHYSETLAHTPSYQSDPVYVGHHTPAAAPPLGSAAGLALQRLTSTT